MEKLKKVINQFWTEFTRVRSIEFNSYETEAETDARLAREFKQRKMEIMEKNSKEIIMGRLVPYIISETLHKQGYLISEQNALPTAVQMFMQAKADGRIDELNSIRKELQQ
jgi:hexokinase